MPGAFAKIDEKTSGKTLFAIIEQGGYPNFKTLYESSGYEVTILHAMRKAMSLLKKKPPQVVIAEFNYQSDFRDRTSNLESLLATVEQMSRSRAEEGIKVIIFYEKEYEVQLEKLKAVFSNFQSIPFPVDEQLLRDSLK